MYGSGSVHVEAYKRGFRKNFGKNFDGIGSERPTKTEPTGALAKAIVRDFGSFEAFKEEFQKKGATLFGSGWVWLSADKDGKLVITQETVADFRRVGTCLLSRLSESPSGPPCRPMGDHRLGGHRTAIRIVVEQRQLVVKCVGDGRHHSQLLDVRCVLVAIIDLELTLAGSLDVA